MEAVEEKMKNTNNCGRLWEKYGRSKNRYLEEVYSLGDLKGVVWIMGEACNKTYRPET
jgi:hypothetical protein